MGVRRAVLVLFFTSACVLAIDGFNFNPTGPCEPFESCSMKRGLVPFYKLVVGDDDAADQSVGEETHPLPFSSNGCGSSGINVMVSDSMVSCCDLHDACYSACNITRTFCDTEFKKCLKKKCKSGDQQCSSSVSQLEMGATLFGCDAFKKAQKVACSCINTFDDEDTIDEHHAEFWKRLYRRVAELYPEAAKTDEQIETVAAKALEGKRPAVMVYRVLEKYPKLVRFEKGRNPGIPNMDRLSEILKNKDL